MGLGVGLGVGLGAGWVGGGLGLTSLCSESASENLARVWRKEKC